jgi:threonine synthase
MFVTHLECLACGARFAMDPRAYVCAKCGGILDVQYDYGAARARPFSSRGVFRYLALLPVREARVILPAGATPLVSAPRIAARLGLDRVLIKDETRNPTRCLKDRATAVGMALAIESGATEVYCASAGNAAISLAGFAANCGFPCHAFVPSYVSETRLDGLRRFGADIHVSEGNYDQAFEEVEEAGRAHGWYSRNCAFNPFLVEGKKTCALEIAEEVTADFVIAPVGDGCTLGAIGKGFREARELGLIDRLPRLIGVQAQGVRPIVDQFLGTKSREGETEAASIAVRQPRNSIRVLREIRESAGEMIAVTDAQIREAQRALAEEAGIVAEFTSAATLAALESMKRARGATAVLVITGGRVD